MIKNHTIRLLLGVLCLWAIQANAETNYAPNILEDVRPDMLNAGFWVSLQNDPDDIILDSQAIEQFNASVLSSNLTQDIFLLIQDLKTESLLSDFNAFLDELAKRSYFTSAGMHIDDEFIDKSRKAMNLSGIVLGVAPRFGFVTDFADVRLLPTQEGLYEQPGDFEFDQMQNSGLDASTPVAIVHQSRDRQWYYIFANNTKGWVKADKIALADMKAVEMFAHPPRFVVVTAPKVDIFLDEGLTQYKTTVRMGMQLPLIDSDSRRSMVWFPLAGKDGKVNMVHAYVSSDAVHEGYLPYTKRVILNQAFKMLHAPYGWGDWQQAQDCSRFIQMVFATVGLQLPRDSKDQIQVGQLIESLDGNMDQKMKIEALGKTHGATAILGMRGHILMYLGNVEGKHYAIHSLWAYRQPKGGKDVAYVINRVAVSDLNLGEGSSKGSLLKRLNRIEEYR